MEYVKYLLLNETWTLGYNKAFVLQIVYANKSILMDEQIACSPNACAA